MIYLTKCCRFEFWGLNHSPEHAGKCRACGAKWIGIVNKKPEATYD